MKKLLLSILLAVFITSLASSRAFAACGDGDTHSYCGALGQCPTGQICIDGPYPNDAKCEPAGTRCDGVNQTLYRCGYSYHTNNWCGALGGCGDGYKCNEATSTCVIAAECDLIDQSVTGKQCGRTSGIENLCGADGGCKYGYRCVKSGTGATCVADDSSTAAANRCPGSPNQDPVNLTCGEETSNPNVNSCACSGTTLTQYTHPASHVQMYCCGWVRNYSCADQNTVDLVCGDKTSNPNVNSCTCSGTTLKQYTDPTTNKVMYCCGWLKNNTCSGTDTLEPPPNNDGGGNTNPPSDSGNNGGTGGDGSSSDTTPKIDIFAGPTSAEFNLLNPLKTFGNASVTAELSSPGGIISRILAFAFPLAGLILFLMLVIAGFQIVVGGANGTKAIEAGRQRATNALIGFTLLFVAYWLMQIIEVIFGITIF